MEHGGHTTTQADRIIIASENSHNNQAVQQVQGFLWFHIPLAHPQVQENQVHLSDHSVQY